MSGAKSTMMAGKFFKWTSLRDAQARLTDPLTCALAVAAGPPAILKRPLIFRCDGLDFLPNVLCPLLILGGRSRK